MDLDILRKHIPFIESELLLQLQQHAKLVKIPANTPILKEGGSVASVPLVLEGYIKVFSSNEERDLLLYYINPGESCVMSFSACIYHHLSKVAAITEEDSTILLLPEEKLNDWVNQYPALRTFFFSMFNQRYLDVLQTLEQMVFWRLEERLEKYLRDKAKQQESQSLKLRHREIAQDLGTSREVISRVLKKLEVEGRLSLSRNQIDLL